MKNTQTIVVSALTALVIVTGLYLFTKDNSNTLGSVSDGSEYFSTTTRTTFTPAISLAKNGSGAVGNVTITGAAAGNIRLYNATTTDVTKRTGQKATSTILLADIPASAVAGTYVIDAAFSDGLIIDIVGSIPTTTITWR